MNDLERQGRHSADGDASIDEQVETLLRSIEGSSAYVVRSAETPEDLDPDDALDPAPETGDEGADAGGSEDVAEPLEDGSEDGNDDDRDHDGQLVGQVEQADADEQDEESPDVSVPHARLRTALAAAAVVLAVIAVVTGVLIARNTAVPGTGGEGGGGIVEPGQVELQPVDPAGIPAVTEWFGRTVEEVSEAGQGRVVFEGGAEKAPGVEGDQLPYMADGSVLDAAGGELATVTLGLDAKKRCAYAYVQFDLDALGTPDAGFAALYSDETVARSLLEAVGVSSAAVPQGALVLADGAAPAQDDDVESCEFEGETGTDAAPTSWRLTETYDHTTGKLAKDNSAIRTISIELY